MVVIQRISTTWSKQSRGQPGAGRRAAVPEAFSLEATTLGRTTNVIDVVTAAEHEDFRIVRSVEPIESLPARVANVVVEHVGDDLRATRRPDTGGWPSRPRSVVAFDLRPGETGRIIRNWRYSGYHGWSYEKIVLNVANAADLDADVFMTGSPTFLLDEQASLF